MASISTNSVDDATASAFEEFKRQKEKKNNPPESTPIPPPPPIPEVPPPTQDNSALLELLAKLQAQMDLVNKQINSSNSPSASDSNTPIPSTSNTTPTPSNPTSKPTPEKSGKKRGGVKLSDAGEPKNKEPKIDNPPKPPTTPTSSSDPKQNPAVPPAPVEEGDHSINFTGVEEKCVRPVPQIHDTNVISKLVSVGRESASHINWDAEGTASITTRIFTEGTNTGSRSRNVSTHIRNFMNRQFSRSRITFVGSVALAEFLKHNLVDIKNTASMLSGNLNINEHLARQVAANLAMNPYIWDTSSWYAVAWTIYFHRLRYTHTGNVPDTPGFIAGTVVTRNLRPAQAAVDDLADEILHDMQDGRITFIYRDLNPADIQLIYHVASGLPRLQPPEGHHLNDAIGSWQCPTIPTAIYETPANFIAPQPIVQDPSVIFQAIIRMAIARDEGDMCVAGFIRAAELCYTTPVANNTADGDQAYLACTASLQISGEDWTAPRESNWMFKRLDMGVKRFRSSIPDEEFCALQSLSNDEAENLSLVLGGVISSASSTVLNDINITGQVLVNWGIHAEDTRLATNVLNGIFTIPAGKLVSNFWQLVCGTISSLTNLTLSPSIWISSSWCSGGVHLILEKGVVNGNWWASITAVHVPYPTHPLCILFIWKLFAPHWMVMGQPITMNLTAEYSTSGVDGIEGWRSSWGDTSYFKASSSPYGYQYIPYAGHVYQAIRWWLNRAGVLEIGYETFGSRRPLNKPVATTGIMANPPQPVVTADILVVTPGSILSYDWNAACVICPYVAVTRNGLGSRIYPLSADDHINLINGGILRGSSTTTNYYRNDPVGIWGPLLQPMAPGNQPVGLPNRIADVLVHMENWYYDVNTRNIQEKVCSAVHSLDPYLRDTMVPNNCGPLVENWVFFPHHCDVAHLRVVEKIYLRRNISVELFDSWMEINGAGYQLGASRECMVLWDDRLKHINRSLPILTHPGDM